jgi:hypothetical protein
VQTKQNIWQAIAFIIDPQIKIWLSISAAANHIHRGRLVKLNHELSLRKNGDQHSGFY